MYPTVSVPATNVANTYPGALNDPTVQVIG